MPAPLARLALVNKRVVYDLLFQAAAETMRQVASESEAPRWRHRRADGPPHVGPAAAAPSPRPLRRAGWADCRRMAPGGSTRGRASSSRFPCCGRSIGASSSPVSARPVARAASPFPASLAPLATEQAFRAFLRSLYRQAWVVYAKPPFGSPAHVLHYLARYTHRVAISNHRLVDVTTTTVSFRWKDYRHGSQMRTLTLDVDEFLRRFLLHVLPKRFVRIRYFGFLASRTRTRGLARCRQVLAVAPPPPDAPLVTPTSTRLVAVSSLRSAHAPHRTTDRTTALPRRPPRRRSSMTPRERRVRLAIRLLTRRHARTPEVYPTRRIRSPRRRPTTTRGASSAPRSRHPRADARPHARGSARLKGHS